MLVRYKLVDCSLVGVPRLVAMARSTVGRRRLAAVAIALSAMTMLRLWHSYVIENQDGGLSLIHRPDPYVNLTDYSKCSRDNIQYHLIVEGEFFRLCGQTMTGIATVWLNLLKQLSSSKRAFFSCPSTQGPQHKVIYIDRSADGIGSRTIAALRHTCEDGRQRASVIVVPYRESLESTIVEDVPKAIAAAGYRETSYRVQTVYTSTYYTFPNIEKLPAPGVCTILYLHDVIPEEENFMDRGSEWWPRKLATRFVNSFVSVSKSTLRDYVKWYAPYVLKANVTKEKALQMTDEQLERNSHVSVIHNRLSFEEFPGPASKEEIAEFRKTYNFFNPFHSDDKDYILVLRHKSCSLVLKAFDKLPDEYIRKYILVFGTWDYHASDWFLNHHVTFGPPFSSNSRRVEIKIFNIGYLPRNLVRVALSGALALVYVSPYEGFGLPILEAYASGTLVVTSNWSAMPEVAGDSAFYVNKLEVSELSTALARVMALSKKERQARIQAGFRRAAQFGGGFGKLKPADAWEDAAVEFVHHIQSNKHKWSECYAAIDPRTCKF